jgi:predicted glycoside hydrolase/deacetylase ChbG (UPF0249 family)
MKRTQTEPGSPFWIVATADDLGYSPGVDAAIEYLARSGAITAVAIMPLLLDPNHDYFLNGLDLGAHLNISYAPGLSDRARAIEKDRFQGRLERAELDSLRIEWDMQLKIFAERFGIPVHISTHHGVHRNLQVLEIVADIALEYDAFARAYTPEMSKALTRRGVRHLSTSIMIPPSEDVTTQDHLAQIEAEIDDHRENRTCEVVFHPGLVDHLLPNHSSMVHGRITEFEILYSGMFRDTVLKRGGVVTRYPRTEV